MKQRIEYRDQQGSSFKENEKERRNALATAKSMRNTDSLPIRYGKQNNVKFSNRNFQGECYVCHEFGHMAQDCAPAFKLFRAGLKNYRTASHENITTFSSSFSSDPSQANMRDKDGLEKKTCSNSKFKELEILSQSDYNGCVIARRTRAVSMRAPITVCHQQINAIVDSGAEVTVMSRDLYYRLTKAEKGLVVAEKDRIMPTDGVAMMPLIIGDSQFEWPVYVAAIVDELLLGCDLLDAKDITLNTRRGLLIDGS